MRLSRPKPARATDRADTAAMARTMMPATFHKSVASSRSRPWVNNSLPVLYGHGTILTGHHFGWPAQGRGPSDRSRGVTHVRVRR